MGVIIRQGFRNSLGLYLGVFLGAINTLFISTFFLSSEELAISRLLIENSLVISAFAHLGAPHILDRFFARFKKNETQNNGLLVYLLMFPHIGMILVLTVYFIFKQDINLYFVQKSPDFVPFLWLSLPMAYLWSIFVILEAHLRSYKSTFFPTILRESVFRIFNILTIIVYGLKLINFQTFLLLQVVSIIAILLFLIGYVKKNNVLFLDIKNIHIDKDLRNETIRFGSIVIFGGLGASLILFIDRNIIAHKIGTQAAAIFIISTYLSSIIEIPTKAVKQISMPFLSEYFIKSDFVNIENLYKKASVNFFLLAGFMFIIVFFNIGDVLSILPKSEIYKEGKWIVIIITGGKCLEIALGLNNELIAFSKYYKFNTYLILIMMVLIIALNYLLIPIYGVLGSAIATAIITIFSSVTRLIYVKAKFNFENNEARFLYMTFLIVFVFILALFLNFIHFDNRIMMVVYMIFKSVLLFIIFVYFCYRFKFSVELNAFVSQLILNLKKLKGI